MKKYLLPILLIGFWSCEEEVEEGPILNPDYIGNWSTSVSYSIDGDCSGQDETSSLIAISDTVIILDDLGNFIIPNATDCGPYLSCSGAWTSENSIITLTFFNQSISIDHYVEYYDGCFQTYSPYKYMKTDSDNDIECRRVKFELCN